MINHTNIVAYFKQLATELIGVNDFFRMDLTEIQGAFRSTAKFPCLVLESHELDLSNSNIMQSVANRTFAFTIYTHPKKGNYDQQNEFLDLSETLGLKIIARMRHDARQKDHLIENAFKVEEVTSTKVGPVFSNQLYGYRFVGSFTKSQPLIVDANDWNDTPVICE